MTRLISLIIVGAAIFDFVIETTVLPLFMVGLIDESGLPPMAVLVFVKAFYLVLGFVMDTISMILLTIPTDPEGEVGALELTEYLLSTVHMQG